MGRITARCGARGRSGQDDFESSLARCPPKPAPLTMSGHLARLLQQAGQGPPASPPILALTAAQPLVHKPESTEHFPAPDRLLL